MRCLIVDDDAGFRAEVCGLLEEEGVEVVGSAASGAEAVRKVASLRPDVALVDINLRGESGFDLARQMRDGAGGAAPNVILISTHDESEYADLIEASPAAGFLAKNDLSAVTIRRILDDAAAFEGDDR